MKPYCPMHGFPQTSRSMFTPNMWAKETVGLDVARYDPVTQLLEENHVQLTAEGITMSPIVCRLITPGEMDLPMVRGIAGMRLIHRYANWQRTPFDITSTAHVSMYGF